MLKALHMSIPVSRCGQVDKSGVTDLELEAQYRREFADAETFDSLVRWFGAFLTGILLAQFLRLRIPKIHHTIKIQTKAQTKTIKLIMPAEKHCK